jgi:salicylate hydroxylase
VASVATECLLAADFTSVRGPVLRKSDTPSSGVDFSQIPHGPRLVPRDALLDILHTHTHAGQCQIETNKKMKSYVEEESGRVTLRFEDGSQFTADVLIGADGVHSRVRRHMFLGNDVLSAPHFSGQFAYRMSCPRADVQMRYPNNVALDGFKIVRLLRMYQCLGLTMAAMGAVVRKRKTRHLQHCPG